MGLVVIPRDYDQGYQDYLAGVDLDDPPMSGSDAAAHTAWLRGRMAAHRTISRPLPAAILTPVRDYARKSGLNLRAALLELIRAGLRAEADRLLAS